MKKTIFKFITLILVIVSVITCFSCADPVSVHINLNHAEADYTDEYRSANGDFTSKNLSKIVGNKKMTDLPTADDLIAPSGKLFAGWYFDKEGSVDKIYNQANWDILFSEKTGTTVYAKWINSNETLFIFDVSNQGDFTSAFKTSNSITGKLYQKTVVTLDLATQVANFPSANDIVAPSNTVFAGWYLDANGNKPLTAENFMSEYNAKKGNYTLYPKFEELPTIRLIYHWDGFNILDGVAEEHYDSEGFYNVSRIVLDDGNTYSIAVNSLPKEEYFDLYNYVFDGWYLDSEFTIEFNETNYNSAVETARQEAIFSTIDISIYLKSHWEDQQ